MANTVYPKGLKNFMGKSIDLVNDNIKVALVSSTYTYSATHEFVSDLSGIIVRSASNLSSKTTTSGVFTAANLTYTAVASGSTVAGLVVYDDTPATDAGKFLLCFIDHDASAAVISLATNGGDITIAWNGSGIFSI